MHACTRTIGGPQQAGASPRPSSLPVAGGADHFLAGAVHSHRAPEVLDAVRIARGLGGSEVGERRATCVEGRHEWGKCGAICRWKGMGVGGGLAYHHARQARPTQAGSQHPACIYYAPGWQGGQAGWLGQHTRASAVHTWAEVCHQRCRCHHAPSFEMSAAPPYVSEATPLSGTPARIVWPSEETSIEVTLVEAWFQLG